MSSQILIVEDQFIEANDLRIVLEKAGHIVCGIAKSVEQAVSILKKVRPDIVLLDIFLVGKLTGIDLAKMLTNDNIPFIYLSANSDELTFENAKATHPYGFLVKPFREKDILNALDIASYRYNHTVELMRKQEKWLSSLLENIIAEPGDMEQKLLLLAKAFKPFIYFDYLVIDTNIKSDGPGSIFALQRIGYGEYAATNGWEFLKKINITLPELNYFRRTHLNTPLVHFRNNADFANSFLTNILEERLNQLYKINAGLYIPVLLNGEVEMSISFYSHQANYFNADHEELLNTRGKLLYNVIDNIRQQNNILQGAPGLTKENVNEYPSIEGIVGKNAGLLHVLDQVSQVAAFDTTLLILGETGVGKEGIAKAVHQLSNRKLKPYIKINCAAIPASLIESELFGHEKGAFTSAIDRRIGKFEQAQGGTIFLDEIGEIPLELQSKLLRVLQEKELERLGGRTTIKVDVRIIAATNRNLYKEVAAGKFRIDLYYRINVFPITLPALRDRKDDIPCLLITFYSKMRF